MPSMPRTLPALPPPLRLVATLTLVTAALGVPRVGLSDVALPDAVYELADGESCPDASELTLADVTVNDYGCDVEALDALYSEDADRCYYSVIHTCDTGGGGCNN